MLLRAQLCSSHVATWVFRHKLRAKQDRHEQCASTTEKRIPPKKDCRIKNSSAYPGHVFTCKYSSRSCTSSSCSSSSNSPKLANDSRRNIVAGPCISGVVDIKIVNADILNIPGISFKLQDRMFLAFSNNHVSGMYLGVILLHSVVFATIQHLIQSDACVHLHLGTIRLVEVCTHFLVVRGLSCGRCVPWRS